MKIRRDPLTIIPRHYWFAWRPVLCDGAEPIWLETVVRSKFGLAPWTYERCLSFPSAEEMPETVVRDDDIDHPVLKC